MSQNHFDHEFMKMQRFVRRVWIGTVIGTVAAWVAIIFVVWRLL
ncbi:hypothetical protein OSH11_11840 [Kaistia dalseonensis]|uniref:Uncharacterized protein n=1 Tax=Kaistia dalseonensis TaxID=410840 RepID=A0ABU0H6P8_9HYPH|nr:hypothetical protein [Kaistia dalseonensis]MCX5495400.1 hypothetical protein [Kaistia dalseonensis]MDQ0437988.1 hypothetical protein [Kaistia dalseonensis]